MLQMEHDTLLQANIGDLKLEFICHKRFAPFSKLAWYYLNHLFNFSMPLHLKWRVIAYLTIFSEYKNILKMAVEKNKIVGLHMNHPIFNITYKHLLTNIFQTT